MKTGTTAVAALVSNQGNWNRRLARSAVLTAAVALTVGGARPAMAGTETWVGASGVNWNDALNWTGDNLPPAATDVLVFGGSSNTTTNNDYGANTQFNGISFAAGASTFALNGNSVLLGGDIMNNSAVAQAINLPLTLDGATSNVSTPGGGALSLGPVTFGLAAQSANVSTMNLNDSLSATSLTVQTNSTGINTIGIAAGKTFTVGGSVTLGTPGTSGAGNLRTNVTFSGGGDFVASGAGGNFYVGLGNTNGAASADRNVARVDMTGLANFSYTAGGLFGVGWGTRSDAQLKLTPGTNTIVASQVHVGDTGMTGTGSSPNNFAAVSTLFLGEGTNVINTGNLTIGNIKGVGVVNWVNPSTGSVTIAGQTGGASTANITIGRQSSATGTSTASQLLLAGHNATVQGGTVVIGHLNGATGATATGAITFDTGTFTANSLQIGVNQTGTSANGVRGTFTLGTDGSSTGALTVNSSFILGNDTNTNNVPTRAAFVMNGGTATINTDIQVVSTDTNGDDESTLTLVGGTMNMTGHNIGSAASPVKMINLNGGTLSNANKVYGTTINVTAPLSVTGSGTSLVIAPGGTLAAASPLDVISGVTIAGGTSGTAANVNGNVTAKSGSRVAPGPDATTAGTLQFANDLSFESGSAAKFKLSPDSGSGNDLINVSGNLSFAGTVNLEIGALGTGATIGQTYTLINYSGSLTGDETNITIIGTGSRKTFTLVPTASTPNQIKLAVGGSDPLSITYVGNGSSTWSAAGPTNWQDGSAVPQQFFNQDTATFDDTSTNPADVQLVGSLTSGGVTVSAARNYKFAGTGSLTGTTGLTKALGGTLVVATDNTNTGTTDIQGGTLRVGDGGTTGSIGSGAINNNGTLAFKRTDSTTIANVINGSGSVIVETGSVALTAANGYTGTTTIKNGATVKINGNTSLGSTSGDKVVVESGGTLDIGGAATANTLNLGAKHLEIAGNGTDGTVGAITNSSTLSQFSSFHYIKLTADATITGSRMDIGRNPLGGETLDLNGKTLTLNMSGVQPIFGVQAGAVVTAGNIVVNTGGFNIETTSVLDDIGGTVTFNAGTVFQAYQTVDGAIKRPLVFKGGNTIGSGNANLATVNSNITLDGSVTLQALASGVPGTGNFPIDLKGAISGVGGITKVGTNSVTLTGTNTYAGATAINGGTLVLGGSNTGSSSLAVADGAVVQVVNGATSTERFGGLNLNTSGKFDIDGAKIVLGGTTASTVLSYLQRGYAGGSWTGNGLTSAGAQGTAEKAIGWAAAGDIGLTGGSWGSATGLSATDIVAKLTYFGDLNLDGRVNGDDYVMLDRYVAIHGLGATTDARWVDGDVNYDGSVTSADYLLTDTAFGLQTGTLSPDFLAARQAQFGGAYVTQLVAAVPEPASVGLVAAGSLLALRRRRK